MPPPVALVLTIALIVYLTRRELRATPDISTAVWIPVLWLLLNGSRQPSQWLGTNMQIASLALHEGNVVDQAVYGALIVSGLLVLLRRRFPARLLVNGNEWMIVLFLYAGVSFVWSDFPLTSLKRVVKASGDIVMVLVLVTEAHPAQAIVTTLKRCGHVLIPLSVLFCRYYENMGRVFDDWGRSYYTGVTLDKNMLGYLLFVYGLLFTSSLIAALRSAYHDRRAKLVEVSVCALMLAMIHSLTLVANSKTSLLTLLMGVTMLVALQIPLVRQRFWTVLILGFVAAAVINVMFPLRDAVLEASGRDASLTGRTGIWTTVLSEPINPILGTGYASFWLGERLARIWALYPLTPLLQAHNGYIELYLNLGLLGVALLAGVLWRGLIKAKVDATCTSLFTLSRDEKTHRLFSLAYISTYLVYNISEATFMGLNFLFITFLMAAVSIPAASANAETSDFLRRLPRIRRHAAPAVSP